MSNAQDVPLWLSDVGNDYNRIFETLVQEDKADGDDLSGLVAYALYKRAKKEWAAKLWQDEHRKPNADDLRNYAAFWTGSQLKSLQSQAQSTLNAYASAFIDAATPDIREAAIKDEVRGIRQDVAAEAKKAGNWPSWGWAVVASLVAAAAYTAFLIFAAWVIKKNGIDLISLLK